MSNVELFPEIKLNKSELEKTSYFGKESNPNEAFSISITGEGMSEIRLEKSKRLERPSYKSKSFFNIFKIESALFEARNSGLATSSYLSNSGPQRSRSYIPPKRSTSRITPLTTIQEEGDINFSQVNTNFVPESLAYSSSNTFDYCNNLFF